MGRRKRAKSGKGDGATYAGAGVSLDAADEVSRSMVELLRGTYGPEVIDNPEGFGGLYRLSHDLRGGRSLFDRSLREPVLVASCDGVGTKLVIAFRTGIHTTVGRDLVAMSVNDLVVQGAEPMFFLDYVVTGRIRPEVIEQVVRGIADGCREAGCALLGGETAEHPGTFPDDEYDLAGFAVGIANKSRLLGPTLVEPGDDIVGIGSSGVHSNGFSLVRHVIFERTDTALDACPDEFEGRSVGEVLLTPTVIYARPVIRTLAAYKVKRPVRSLAHITGGGIPGNVARSLPKGTRAVLDPDTWDVPAVFPWLQDLGDIPEAEMYRVFNMGLGMTMVVRPHFTDAVVRRLQGEGVNAWRVGRVEKARAGRAPEVRIRGVETD